MTPLSELKETGQDSQIRTVTGQTAIGGQNGTKRKAGKTHQDYWFSRLQKRNYVDRHGRTVEVPDWQVRFQIGGKDQWFNLGSPNRDACAKKARDIYVFIQANGMKAAIARFKADAGEPARLTITVGDYLDAVEATGLIQLRTLINYRNCFRTILSEAFSVRSDRTRFDYRTDGNKQWVGRIDKIRLQRVTPERVNRWKKNRLEAAGSSPTAIASAKRTINAYIRCARSLFSDRIKDDKPSVLHEAQKALGTVLASPLPFDGVGLFKAGSMKYVSKLNAAALIAAAKAELKANDAEAYKAFVLGISAGMRKGEIDLAEWRMLDFAKNLIRLEQTEWLHLKTEDSAGEITVDSEVMAELRELMPKGKGRFIIQCNRPPRNDSARAYYRCEPIFDRLNAWLRSKGVAARKPLHELRKELGALIASQDGIYAASRFLRHSDITTTARHYADQKSRISVGLGKLFRPEPTVVGKEAAECGD